MKEVTIKLYSFTELTENSQQYAIEKHRQFMLDMWREEDFETREDYESELGAIEDDDGYVEENIITNDYMFYSDGNLANITHYTGKHEKSGITEFKLGNDVYIIY